MPAFPGTYLAVIAALALGGASVPGTAAAQGGLPASRGDSSDVAAVVERFSAALAAGDSATALALLSSDVVILESGGAESLADYRSHHLPADIEFSRAVPGRHGPLTVRVLGDVAWASRTGTAEGTYRGRAVNSASAELMILTRAATGWTIRAIHWSSRSRRAGGG